jgi:hypothetical protein
MDQNLDLNLLLWWSSCRFLGSGLGSNYARLNPVFARTGTDDKLREMPIFMGPCERLRKATEDYGQISGRRSRWFKFSHPDQVSHKLLIWL